MVLRSQYLSMAWGERSRPDPESLKPPNGVAMDERSKAFTHTVPPLRKAPQDPLALLRLHAPPRAGLETGARRGHRGIDIRGPAAGYLTQDLAVDGTDVIEHAAVAGRDRAACDEGAAFGPQGGGQPFPGAAVALQGRGAHGTKLP